ncbi:5-formyltetrahydrofolate cyclo-ligase [Thermomonas flagellata]|uniref:5-formyltetrahydrofolate cyclo-ligase n=1 Tax=Thermomonas flagellata TaxID=2888524 RepID=UPI001F04B2CA
MTPDADRAALRRQLRQRRRGLSAAQRVAAAEALGERLLALPAHPRRGYVAGYWAVDGEIGLHAWQLRLPPGLVYCLPVLHADGRLRFAPWRPGDPLVSNRHGIPEPDVGPGALLEARELAMAVLPLVGFAADGRRLGMGGGWYDRSFGFRRTQAAPPLLVGVGFDEQEAELPPDAPWDVRPDALCTPTRTLQRPPA